MAQNLWLLVRNIAMIIAFPGIVAVYIPYRILYPIEIFQLDSLSTSQYSALLLLVIGNLFLFASIWTFAFVGKGTLAPFDETKKLIVVGLHRYVRNPMYIGVLIILVAESWFFYSISLTTYTMICFLVANVIVIGYEESRLKYKYGDEYTLYCENVRRWIPGKPYTPMAD